MEAVGVAASVLAIATAGAQISIKLVTFSNQIATAASRVRMIANDVSLTSNVLQQLGDLMKKDNKNDATSIFSDEAIQSTQNSADACRDVFEKLDQVLKQSSMRVQSFDEASERKFTMSKREKLKWPFLQPGINDLRNALRDARDTLMLILQVNMLACSVELAHSRKHQSDSLDNDQSTLEKAIFALYREKRSPRHRRKASSRSIHSADEAQKENASDTSALSRNGPCLTNNKNSMVIADLPSEVNQLTSNVNHAESTSGILGESRVAENEKRHENVVSEASSPHHEDHEAEDLKLGANTACQVIDSKKDHSTQHVSQAAKMPNRHIASRLSALIDPRSDVPAKRARDRVIEACQLAPRIDWNSPDSLVIRWYVYKLPLEQEEILRQINRPHWWTRGNIMRKLAKLSPMEERVMYQYISEHARSTRRPEILAIDFERKKECQSSDVMLLCRKTSFYLEEDVHKDYTADDIAAAASAAAAGATAEAEEVVNRIIAEHSAGAGRTSPARANPADAGFATPPSMSPRPTEQEPPIRFKDAVGRRFVFPFHLCKTWTGIEDLISQAFLHIEGLGSHVAEGHYDLVGPQGDIILPQVWGSMVEPGMTVTMHFWPLQDIAESEQPSVGEDSVVVVPDAPPKSDSKVIAKKKRPQNPSYSTPSSSGSKVSHLSGKKVREINSILLSDSTTTSKGVDDPEEDGIASLHQHSPDTSSVNLDGLATSLSLPNIEAELSDSSSSRSLTAEKVVKALLLRYTTVDPTLWHKQPWISPADSSEKI